MRILPGHSLIFGLPGISATLPGLGDDGGLISSARIGETVYAYFAPSLVTFANWTLGGVDIPGATSPSFGTSSLTADDQLGWRGTGVIGGVPVTVAPIAIRPSLDPASVTATGAISDITATLGGANVTRETRDAFTVFNGAPGDLTMSISPALPSGSTFDAAGLLTFSPNAALSQTYTVTATVGASSATATVAVTVATEVLKLNNGPRPLNVIAGVEIFVEIAAVGGDGNFTFAGPAGWAIGPGNPANPNSRHATKTPLATETGVVFTVTDGLGATASTPSFTMSVSPATITVDPEPSAAVVANDIGPVIAGTTPSTALSRIKLASYGTFSSNGASPITRHPTFVDAPDGNVITTLTAGVVLPYVRIEYRATNATTAVVNVNIADITVAAAPGGGGGLLPEFDIAGFPTGFTTGSDGTTAIVEVPGVKDGGGNYPNGTITVDVNRPLPAGAPATTLGTPGALVMRVPGYANEAGIFWKIDVSADPVNTIYSFPMAIWLEAISASYQAYPYIEHWNTQIRGPIGDRTKLDSTIPSKIISNVAPGWIVNQVVTFSKEEGTTNSIWFRLRLTQWQNVRMFIHHFSPPGVVAAPPTQFIPTASATTFNMGIPLANPNRTAETLSAALPVGSYYTPPDYTGQPLPFLVSSAASQITDLGIQSYQDTNGFWANGAMQNLYALGVFGDRGFNDAITQTAIDGLNTQSSKLVGGVPVLVSSYLTPYNHPLNKNTYANGPVPIAIGDEFSISQFTRKPNATILDRPTIDGHFLLNVVSEAPPVGSLAPPAALADKTPILNMNDYDDTCWANVDPVPGFPTFEEALAKYHPVGMHPGFLSDQLRGFDVAKSVGTDVYGATQMQEMMDLLLICHFNTTTLAQRKLASWYIGMQAVQIYGPYARGDFFYGWGAGNHGPKHGLVWAGAYIFRNPILFAAAGQILGNELDQVLLYRQEHVGGKTRWPSSRPKFEQPVLQEMVGTPFFRLDGRAPVYGYDSSNNAEYHARSWQGRAPAMLALQLMKGGSGQPDGHLAFHGNTAATPDRVHATQALDVFMMRSRFEHANRANQWHIDFYHAHRDKIPVPRWTGILQPMPMIQTNPSNSRFSAAAGGISYNYTSEATCANPIAQGMDYSSSIDNVFFSAPVRGGISATVPRPVIPLYNRARFYNANGEGPWSFTFAERPSEPNASLKTPTGTPSGATVCVENPAIMLSKYPLTGLIIAEPITTNFPSNQGNFLIGLGDWRGNLSGGFTKQIERSLDGGATVSATPFTTIDMAVISYQRSTADINVHLRVKISCNGVVAYSPWVLMPALETLPADVIFRSHYDGEYPLRYPNHLALAQANNNPAKGTLVHNPELTWGGSGASKGGFYLDKNGQFALCAAGFEDHIEGRQYEIDVDIPVDVTAVSGNELWAANGTFRVSNSPTAGTAISPGTVELTIVPNSVFDEDGNRTDWVYQIRGYRYIANATTMWHRISIGSGGGGIVGGDPGFSFTEIRLLPL